MLVGAVAEQVYQQHGNSGVQQEGPHIPWVGQGGDQREGSQRPITAQGRRGEEEPGIHDIDIADTHNPGGGKDCKIAYNYDNAPGEYYYVSS